MRWVWLSGRAEGRNGISEARDGKSDGRSKQKESTSPWERLKFALGGEDKLKEESVSRSGKEDRRSQERIAIEEK
jgi:hypothetical protein